METEFQNAIGKSMGEVARDVAEFLSCSCVIHPKKQIDLFTLLPDLNMTEQFSFAFFSEAEAQGHALSSAESFYRHAVASVVEDAVIDDMVAAFEDQSGAAYQAYDRALSAENNQ